MQQMISPPRHGTMINPRASVAGIDAANGQCWYEIRALAAGRVEIFLYDVIGGWGITAQQFVSDCKEAGVFEASAVDLHIHSPGGDVMQGFAIFNTLSRLKAKLDIWVDGVAASMASMIVCLPGATVHMPENAWLMVHKPWGGIAGDSDDMRDYAAWLDRNEALMLSAYMNKTGLGQEELESMLKAETWLNGAEAVEKGFADTLEPELQAAACVNQNKLKDYQNMPEQIKNLFGPRAEGPASQPQPAQNPAPQAANNPPAHQPTQQPLAGNIDITALAAQLQQQMQAANTERVSAVSAVFDAFPAFGSLKAECITDISCSAEQARTKLLNALAAGTTPSAGPGAVHIHAGNGNIVGDSIRAAVMNRAGYAQAEKDNAYNGYTGDISASNVRGGNSVTIGDGTGGLATGGVDGAGFNGNNMNVKSWDGIGFQNAADLVIRAYISTKLGIIAASESVYAGSANLYKNGDVYGDKWSTGNGPNWLSLFLEHLDSQIRNELTTWTTNNFPTKSDVSAALSLKPGRQYITQIGVYQNDKSKPFMLHDDDSGIFLAPSSSVHLDANGWHRDASTGLITQWGSGNVAGGQQQRVNFPMTFPNTCVTVVANDIGSGTLALSTISKDTGGFTVKGSSTIFGFNWLSMGY
ncbi:hypothetical protein CD613_12990 [Salmonella enterica]|nr:hypothetical protein [Salmonella enterica]